MPVLRLIRKRVAADHNHPAFAFRGKGAEPGYFCRQAGYAPHAVFLLFGAAFGIVLQRSRFCLMRAFREPFMSGESEHGRAG